MITVPVRERKGLIAHAKGVNEIKAEAVQVIEGEGDRESMKSVHFQTLIETNEKVLRH